MQETEAAYALGSLVGAAIGVVVVFQIVRGFFRK